MAQIYKTGKLNKKLIKWPEGSHFRTSLWTGQHKGKIFKYKGNFMKKTKNEKCSFEPQKDFFIQNLSKKLCSTKKVCLKYPQNIEKTFRG